MYNVNVLPPNPRQCVGPHPRIMYKTHVVYQLMIDALYTIVPIT